MQQLMQSPGGALFRLTFLSGLLQDVESISDFWFDLISSNVSWKFFSLNKLSFFSPCIIESTELHQLHNSDQALTDKTKLISQEKLLIKQLKIKFTRFFSEDDPTSSNNANNLTHSWTFFVSRENLCYAIKLHPTYVQRNIYVLFPLIKIHSISTSSVSAVVWWPFVSPLVGASCSPFDLSSFTCWICCSSCEIACSIS